MESLQQEEHPQSPSFVSVSPHHDSNYTSGSSTQSGPSGNFRYERRLSPLGEEVERIYAPREYQMPAAVVNPEQQEILNEHQSNSITKEQPYHNTEDEQLYEEPNHISHRRYSTPGRYRYSQERDELNPFVIRFNKIQPIKDVFAASDSVYFCDGSNIITGKMIWHPRRKEIDLSKKADFITIRSNVLYFVNCREKKIFKFENNNTSILHNCLWTPNGLATLGDDKIYVCLFEKNEKKGKVVLFKTTRSRLEMEKEIEHKQDKPHIFSHPKFIAVNSKGDACVSDQIKKRVIVVNTSCRIRFKFRGEYSGKNKPFQPEGLSCDNVDNVYVADKNNYCVDIVNPNGHWLNSVYNLPSPICVASDDEALYITIEDGINIGCILVHPIPELLIEKF